MGRHDFSFDGGTRRVALATGLYASTPVQTAFGWSAAGDLRVGDLVMTRDDGLVPVSAVQIECRRALWSVRLPVDAVGTHAETLLPPGQSVLIRSSFALPFSGDDLGLIPATALEGWRGITAHVPALTEPILHLRLPRSAVLFAGPGLMVGCDGTEQARFDLKQLLHCPSRPVLPLAAARQMVAALVAEETGEGFKQFYAADLRDDPNRS